MLLDFYYSEHFVICTIVSEMGTLFPALTITLTYVLSNRPAYISPLIPGPYTDTYTVYVYILII